MTYLKSKSTGRVFEDQGGELKDIHTGETIRLSDWQQHDLEPFQLETKDVNQLQPSWASRLVMGSVQFKVGDQVLLEGKQVEILVDNGNGTYDVDSGEGEFAGAGVSHDIPEGDLKPILETEEDWIDPAGGHHSPNEEDPAAMYASQLPNWATKLGAENMSTKQAVWQPQEESVGTWYDNLDAKQLRRLREQVVKETGQTIPSVTRFNELESEKQMAIALVYDDMDEMQRKSVTFPQKRQMSIYPLDQEKLP
jgi:hypothetical protein